MLGAIALNDLLKNPAVVYSILVFLSVIIGVIGSVLTSFFVPRVQWGIEKSESSAGTDDS